VGWVRIFFTLIFVSGVVCAQDAVAKWLPIHVGDKWTYEHTTRDEHGEGRAHPEIYAWKTDETIVSSWPVPEGTLVERQVRVIEGSLADGWTRAPHISFAKIAFTGRRLGTRRPIN
jgi:hypothetical protein